MPGGLRAGGFVVTVVAILAAPVLLGSQAVSAAAGGAAPRVPVLRWTDCGGGFQCASARVPLDYRRRSGTTIALALVRLPAADPSRRIGSLFTNPGGPGASGVEFVRAAARTAYPSDVRARFDIVGFDPRGVAGSTPVRCFTTEEARARFFGRLPLFPVTANEQRTYTSAMADLGRRCAARAPSLLAHVSTADVARDLDLLREAVGDRRLTFAGYSYGTLLGEIYANLFPGRVRALVLDAVVDPLAWTAADGGWPTWNRVGTPVASAKSLQAFLELCTDAGRRCAFSAGDPRRELERTLARVRSRPVAVPTPFGSAVVTYALAVGLIEQALYVPGVWPELASFLAALRNASASATPAPRAPHRTSGGGTGGDSYDNGREAQLAVACGETANPRDPAAWPAMARRADRRAPYVGALWTWLSLPCATWPARAVDRYAGPWDRDTGSRVLVVGTRGDPATPYRAARHLAHMLPGARLLTLNAYGHGALGRSRCVEQRVARYLVEGRLPAPGTTCEPDARPFQTHAPVGFALPGVVPIPFPDLWAPRALGHNRRTVVPGGLSEWPMEAVLKTAR